MEIVYIDSYFFWNLLADYLLCLAAARVCALRLRRGRYFLAALLGAAYAAGSLLPALALLRLPAARLSAGLLMGLTAFGGERRPLRCAAVLLGVAAAAGGALWALSMALGGGGALLLRWRTLLPAFLLCYGALSLFFRGRGSLPEKARVPVKAVFLGRTAEFTALVDTGNQLRDPASGAPVLVASPRALAPLLGSHAPLLEAPPVELLERADRVPQLKGRFRLIPYAALGGGGLLPAFRPESLLVDGAVQRDLLIAVSPGAAGEGFDAIV